MEFEKHFCSEDIDRLSQEINTMHHSSLSAIDCALKGDMYHAEQETRRLLRSLQVVKAMNAKKMARDERERLMQGRSFSNE
ncbi:hypothetical protein KO561_13045 [Radiobacillus kanasensis]|uniref:hypothetical protein n=1 Tax=Radiobacillus kanasensis TaxID=2844358 RepID=UPI001E5B7A4A|nr:hypothetical protein [Radiobacillus kanasensis]UFT98129.1 hypothetical protein KO561_13045 [Radiobacillus kanasensis]